MALNTMYPGIPYSPPTELSQPLGPTDTMIYVCDASVFPPAPNIAVIGVDENAETIIYTGVTATALTGAQRGVEGAAKAWYAGEPIGRNFTNYDYQRLIDNIQSLNAVARVTDRANFDEFTTPGLYNLEFQEAVTITPENGTAFTHVLWLLEVLDNNWAGQPGNSVVQRATRYGGSWAQGVFTRVRMWDDSGWGPWYRLDNDKAMFNAPSGVGVGANVFDSFAGGGSGNAIFGNVAFWSAQDGERNTVIGNYAGVMASVGNITNVNRSVFVGCNTWALNAAGDANENVFGYEAGGGGSNSVTLGNSSIEKLRCQVTAITALSDRRIKEEISPADLGLCLAAVKALPVTRYRYKDFTGTHRDKHVTGWLADDVEKVFPKAVTVADQWFQALDENGLPVYESVEESYEDVGEDGSPVRRTRTVTRPKRFQMEGVKEITMTEALPTLWGAVQALIAENAALAARVTALETQLAAWEEE